MFTIKGGTVDMSKEPMVFSVNVKSAEMNKAGEWWVELEGGSGYFGTLKTTRCHPNSFASRVFKSKNVVVTFKVKKDE